VVRECAWLPNWAFSVKRTLPVKLKNDIQAALLILKAGHPVMKALKIDSFRRASDTDYDTIRKASGTK
jgi:phosphonate transport system substrate-binding protein